MTRDKWTMAKPYIKIELYTLQETNPLSTKSILECQGAKSQTTVFSDNLGLHNHLWNNQPQMARTNNFPQYCPIFNVRPSRESQVRTLSQLQRIPPF